MSTEGRQSWFRGHEAWYVRATVWFAQSAIVGTVLFLVLGTQGVPGAVGTVVTGLVSALLLFRQVDAHVDQKLG